MALTLPRTAKSQSKLMRLCQSWDVKNHRKYAEELGTQMSREKNVTIKWENRSQKNGLNIKKGPQKLQERKMIDIKQTAGS